MSILKAWQNRDMDAFLESLQEKSDLNSLHPATGYSSILENIAQTVSQESKQFAEAVIRAGANVDLLNATTGKTALHLAAEKLNFPVMEALLQANADVNQADLSDNTVLHILAKKVPQHLDQLHEKCLELVLSRPDLYLNRANQKNMTPVLTAYEQGAWRVMHKLLKAGAVVENLDYKSIGKKSLREEIRERCPEILHELPNSEFDYSGPQPEMKFLKTFLHIGSEDKFCYEFNIYMADVRLRNSKESQKDCLKLLNIAVKRQLLKASQVLLNFIKQNLPVGEKISPNLANILIQACKTGNPKLVQMMVDEEQDQTQIAKCLHVLTEEQPFTENHATCLKLIARKCNPQIDQINDHGETALHRAAKHDNPSAVQILLDTGASIFQVDDYGQHAYELIPNEIFESFLNSKIEKDAGGGAYYLDLEFLSPNSKTTEDEKKYLREMEQIRQLADSNKGLYITHPVFKAFIAEKWQSYLPLFYVITLLTAVFDVTLIFYITESLRNFSEHFATRVILIIFLTAFFISTIVHLPSWQALERGNRWLSCVLKILSLTILVRPFHSYPDWGSLVFVATGIFAAVHVFMQIGRHQWFGVSYVLSGTIFLNCLKSHVPYFLAICVIETAIPSLPQYVNILSICRYLLLAIFFTHLIGLSFDSAREILSNRDYYMLKLQADTLADFEDTFLTRGHFLFKYFQMPEFRGVNTLLFFAQRNERMRLNTNRGNVLEGFGLKRKPSWWTRAVTLDEKSVNHVREICRKVMKENCERVEPEKSEIGILVAKTDSLVERLRSYSILLEKLENKSRDVENLLIQIMRVNSLRDEQA